MDIRCSKCGEPWDFDSLHDEVKVRYPGEPWFVGEQPEEYGMPAPKWRQRDDGRWYSQKEYEKYFNEVKTDFHTRGCIAFSWDDGQWCQEHPKTQYNEIGSMIAEISGDDIDFEASMWEDAEALGLLGE